VGQPSIQAIRTAARKAGMRTLQEAGLQKVIAGITSVNEIIRVTKA
jgi:type II secretory ATPase GspE/PulE/Tfp pilus assembly ATPase PilB-like protein